MINWANFISQCFNGLVLGALLALISSGLTIIYGTLGVLNLAHGAMFMLGGYAGWVAYTYTGSFIAAVIEGPRVIESFRSMAGATDPVLAVPGTIRGDHALETKANIVHGSDSPTAAERKIKIFFPDLV